MRIVGGDEKKENVLSIFKNRINFKVENKESVYELKLSKWKKLYNFSKTDYK